MYTQQQLEKMTKETLLQFSRSFFNHTKQRKYDLDFIPKPTSSFCERASKAEHIQWILHYQRLHPDDPIYFHYDEKEIVRQALIRLTARELHILCVERGLKAGIFTPDLKTQCVEALLNQEKAVLTEEQKQAFLAVLRDSKVTKKQLLEALFLLRKELKV